MRSQYNSMISLGTKMYINVIKLKLSFMELLYKVHKTKKLSNTIATFPMTNKIDACNYPFSFRLGNLSGH